MSQRYQIVNKIDSSIDVDVKIMKKKAPSADAVYNPGADYKVTTPSRKPAPRDKVFSKSRDNREDRGTRQVKTSQNVNSFPHVR